MLFAEIKEENYPNGKTSKRYNVNSENKKTGDYSEFYESGQIKIKATYKNDLLEGFYNEFLDSGKKTMSVQFSLGQKNGYCRFFEKELIVKEEFWINGFLAFPKSISEITRTLASIPKLKTEFIGEWPKDFKLERFSKTVEADNIAGLAKLREFRYLCNLPYEDLQLQKECIAYNLDGLIIFNKLNGITHTPTNPGLEEKVYQSAYIGTSHSNLSNSNRDMSAAVSIERMYMNDSDKTNIDHVGHRRWCLNPSMKVTGFASDAFYGLMWSSDMSRKKTPEFEFICYPSTGYFPSTHFNSNYVWSISLNPNLYLSPDKQLVKIVVSSVKDKVSKELKITYQNIDTQFIGINNCIIFKPDNVSLSPKSRYHVEITGLKDRSNKEAKVEYYVEFF